MLLENITKSLPIITPSSKLPKPIPAPSGVDKRSILF